MKTYILIIAYLFIGLFACCSTNKKEHTQQQIQFEAQQDTFAQKAKATTEKFKKMDTDELIKELETAALKGQETFNSAAFREIITRKEAGQTLLTSIRDTSQKEFFKLMALKKIDAKLYSTLSNRLAIAILTDALDKSVTFNVWGMPDHYWESSAKAIIEFDTLAKPYLIKLFGNKRATPVWGSEEALEFKKYKYRVCDYALALLYAIDKTEKKTLPASAEARDEMIMEYQK